MPWISYSTTGGEFQSFGAAKRNAQSPRVTLDFMAGTQRTGMSDDLRIVFHDDLILSNSLRLVLYQVKP